MFRSQIPRVRQREDVDVIDADRYVLGSPPPKKPCKKPHQGDVSLNDGGRQGNRPGKQHRSDSRITRPPITSPVIPSRHGPLAVPHPQKTPHVHEVELESVLYRRMTLRVRKAVQLVDGTFLRIAAIKRRLTDDVSEIYIQGPQFRRNRAYEGLLPLKKNEVAMFSVSTSVSLSLVDRMRFLILTNANFPKHRDITGFGDADEAEGRLICRWMVNIVDKTEGYIRRLDKNEVDEAYRVRGSELREGWRGIEATNGAAASLSKLALSRNNPRGERSKKGTGFHKTDATKFYGGGESKTAVGVLSGYVSPAFTPKGSLKIPHTLQPSTSHATTKQPQSGRDGDISVFTPPHRSIHLESHKGFVSAGKFPPGSQPFISGQGPYVPPFSSGRAGQKIMAPPEKLDFGINPAIVSSICDPTSPAFPGKGNGTPSPRQLETSPKITSIVVDAIERPLRRRKSFDGKRPSRRQSRTVPGKPGSTKSRYTFGDAFCGGGGMSSGARSAGFMNTWSFDFDEDAVNTYRANFPRCEIYHSSADQFLALSSGHRLLVDVMHLSPPCQPHSPAHTIAGKDDDRNEASLFCVDKCLEASRPRIVTLEQTDGILNRPEWFRSVVLMFTDSGFSVSWKVLHGIEYGVPQTRKRLFMLAASPGEELPNFPSPSHRDLKGNNPHLPRPRTVIDAISHIPSNATSHDRNPFPTPRTSPVNPHLPLMATILASGGPYDVHPNGMRPFTLRELACLQTFPVGHVFFGCATKQKTQIGNAVPPALAEALLREVRKTLETADRARAGRPGRREILGPTGAERGARPHIPIHILGGDEGDPIAL